MGLGMRLSDYNRDIERSQKIIEYVLAAVVPSLLSLMLFSYFLLEELVLVFLVLSIIAAAAMIWPARTVHRLHFSGWSPNTMPLRIMTGLIGMVYISATSVFAISMMAASQNLIWDHPLTCALILTFLIVLLLLIVFGSRNKARYLRTEKRFFSRPSDEVQSMLLQFLEERKEKFIKTNGRGISFALEDKGYFIKINPLNSGECEVLIEHIANGTGHFNGELKAFMETLA